MSEETIETTVINGDVSALAVINSSEIDQQVATAKKYPRSLKNFLTEAKGLVTLTEEIAGDCIYALPRGKEGGKQKFIEGPSVRFSEIIAFCWGNNRNGARPMGEDKGFVTAQGFFLDLERNTAVMTEVRRKITDKNGKRYNEDMINVTMNAACSIAGRNARLQGIPKAFWRDLYDQAKQTAVGNEKTLVKKRSDMLAYFQKMQIPTETIIEFLGVAGVEDIGLDELTMLKGIATAIKEGTTTIERAFTVEAGKSRAEEMMNGLKAARGEDIKAVAVESCEFCQPENGKHQARCPEADKPE